MDTQIVPSRETDEGVDAPQYPDASTFTFTPDLYLLISRLTALNQQAHDTRANGHNAHEGLLDGLSQGIAQTPPPSSMGTTLVADSQQQPVQVSSSLTQTVSRESGTSVRHMAGLEQGIEVKDLPTHVYQIRQRITRAKEVVGDLPGIDKSIEEQQTEIAQLRRQIRACNHRLRSLGLIARAPCNDFTMTGVEES